MNGGGWRSTDVQPRLDHRETQALFLALADEQLPAPQEQAVRHHLDGCEQCRQGWEGYARTVQRVRSVEREKAPPALASLVAARVRRQRKSGLKGLHLAHAQHRFPVEVLIPLLLAAAVGAFLLMSS
jgi:predicted anti-sigma-YlaC factor YlaD